MRYDLIVIGAGGAGLAAAMYGGRLGLNTLVLGASNGSELPVGGVITTTNIVENYPGFIRISGLELAKKIREHAESYKDVKIKSENVESVEKLKCCFHVKTKKEEYTAKAIIFATGTKFKKLPDSVKGAKELERRGVNYCALCDGPLYKEKIVAVIGGCDSAAKEALILAEYAKKVYIIYRGDEIHPEPKNLEQIKKNSKIEIINRANVVEVKGSAKVEGVILDRTHNGEKEIKLDAIFVAIGHEVLSDVAKKLGVKTNEKGEIIIDHKTCKTSMKGIFAAGDVTDKDFKQLIISVAEGCLAAFSAYEYVSKEFVDFE